MNVDALGASLSDRYRIEKELGQGGMATVYLAEDLRHKRQVAIKVLKPELAAVLGAERFIQEITTTAALQHPHILPLFDSGSADGFLFYVMPYIEGETLRSKLDRETQLGVVAIKRDVIAFYQMMFNDGRPREAIERYAVTTTSSTIRMSQAENRVSSIISNAWKPNIPVSGSM